MNKLIQILVSLKTAVFIIAIISLLSVIGTLVPQKLEAAAYLTKYPIMGKYIISLGFDDIYRSLLFMASLGVLCLSTIFCILVRFKATYNRLINRIKNVNIAELKSLEVKKEISPNSVQFRDKYFKFERIDEDGTKISLHTFGVMSLAGGMILHIGLLLILAGGYIGLVSGVETVIHGREGDKVPIPGLTAMRAGYEADRISRKARYIRNTEANAPILETYRNDVEMLHKIYAEGITAPDFSVSFEKLSIDYHTDNEGEVRGIKSWNSAVSFVKPGEDPHKAVVKVNEPVTFRDYTFYQANWKKYYPTVRLKVVPLENIEDLEKASHFPAEIELTLNKPQKFPWYEHELLLFDFKEDFRIVNGAFVSVSNELKNPAARIIAIDAAAENKEVGRAWGFGESQASLGAHVSNLPFNFVFVSAEPRYESILTVTHDPGKFWVWVGCLLFSVGMMLCFGSGYREVWLVSESDGAAFIAVAGNRTAEVYKKELDKIGAAHE